MAVRNCYASIYADGRANPACAGPGAKDGGATVKIWTRENGAISLDMVEVSHLVTRDGKRIVRVISENGVELSRKEFVR